MIGVWNWNTYDATGITKLAFNTMASVLDRRGSLYRLARGRRHAAHGLRVERPILYC